MREHAAGLLYTPERDRKIQRVKKSHTPSKNLVLAGLSAFGLAAGMLGGYAIQEAAQITTNPSSPPQTPENQSYALIDSTPETLYEATIAADVHAFLFPSPTPTKEPTAIPIPSNIPIATAPLPDCMKVTPVKGESCALPNAYFRGETPTPIPPPSCEQALAEPTAWARVWSRSNEDCIWTGKATPMPQGIEVPIGNPPIIGIS